MISCNPISISRLTGFSGILQHPTRFRATVDAIPHLLRFRAFIKRLTGFNGKHFVTCQGKRSHVILTSYPEFPSRPVSHTCAVPLLKTVMFFFLEQSEDVEYYLLAIQEMLQRSTRFV